MVFAFKFISRGNWNSIRWFYAYSTKHFYIDISSLEVGDTINLQISYSYYFYYFDYCILKYRSSDYNDEAGYLEEFETLDNDNYRYDPDSNNAHYDFIV